jgi:hypothetical protein
MRRLDETCGGAGEAIQIAFNQDAFLDSLKVSLFGSSGLRCPSYDAVAYLS